MRCSGIAWALCWRVKWRMRFAPWAARPVALFASGTAAPTLRSDYDRDFAEPKTDEQLIDQLRTFQGTSEAVLADKELMSLTLPVLRADFLLCGRFRPQERPLLKCPVHVLGGKEDKATTEQLIGWSKETGGSFSVDMMTGGHFFIHEHEARVLRVIKEHLRGIIAATSR